MQTITRLAVVLAAGALAGGCQERAVTPPPASPSPAEAAAAPTPKPGITLEVIDKAGLQKVLQSKQGQIVLIDFWATWCGPCKKAFPHTVELAQKYQSQGLAVVTVSMDDADAHEEALAFLKEQKAEFTNLRSQHGADDAAAEQFEIDNGAIPHLKLYDREGKLVKKFASGDLEGSFTPEDVELAVRELITKP